MLCSPSVTALLPFAPQGLSGLGHSRLGFSFPYNRLYVRQLTNHQLVQLTMLYGRREGKA